MGVTSTIGFKFKLVANGEILDLFKDEEIFLTDNITGLFDLGVLPADFTRTITLPGSKKNNHFFEFVYDISVEDPYTFATNQKVECYLDFDGIYLSSGYMQLNAVNVYQNKYIDSYEVTIYGGLASFGRDLKRYFLTDLGVSLAQFNHTASLENITGSWTGNLFSGSIVYPMCEYGQKLEYTPSDPNTGIDSKGGALCVQDYKPAIRVKEVFDACFEQFGYTYSSSFMNEAFWDDMYMFCNNEYRYPIFPSSSYGLTDFNIETYGLYRITPISGSGTNQLMTINAYNALPWYNIERNPSGILSSSLEWSYAMQTNIRGNINLNFQIAPSGSPDVTYGYGVPQFNLVVQADIPSFGWTDMKVIPLDNINTRMYQVNQYNAGQTKTEQFTLAQQFNTEINGLTTQPALPQGRQLRWKLEVKPLRLGVSNFTVILDQNEPKSYLELTKTNQAGDGLVIDIANNMPYGTAGIKLIDFISSIQKKFNLVIYPNKTKLNEFIIEPFVDWYKTGTIKDFNQYINLNDSIKVTPANNLAVNNLNFGDTLDGDYISQQFAKGANREYGKQYYVDTNNFFSQGTFEVKTGFASSPLTYLQGTGVSGSNNQIVKNCFNYKNQSMPVSTTLYWVDCNEVSQSQIVPAYSIYNLGCVRSGSVTGGPVTQIGICSTTGSTTGSTTSGSISKIYIPTFISSIDYKPVKTLPHIYFYNGLKNCEQYWIEGYVYYLGNYIAFPRPFTSFPYFDYYNGSTPSTNSRSLLFFNEPAVYGEAPTESLYSVYWSSYVNLLYNPYTRLFECNAIIPLADYYKMALHDIVEWRGNYYHLRAINDYNLSNGQCNLQLLGPVIEDVISYLLPGTCEFDFSITAGPTPTASVWDLTSCDTLTTFTGVTFNTTSSLTTASVITWGSPSLYEGCYTLATSSATPDLTGSIVYSVYNSCIACNPPAENCISCSQIINLTYTGNSSYTYPTSSVCSTNSSSFMIDWNVYERPNRISVYDSTGFIAGTGWKGDVNYAGPWGLSIHTATTGTLTGSFVTGSGRYILVEAGGGGGVYGNDTCNLVVNCG
jgi:hypothetical protein